MGAQQSPARPQRTDTATGKPRVLVVEDDEDTSDMVAAFLRLQGFEVAIARNGVEGLAAAPDSFDAITTDLEMPCMDGCEFIQRLRSLPIKPVPIIVMTAQTLDPSMAGQLASCRVMTKPFDLEVLVRLLRSLLAECRHDHRCGATCRPNAAA